MAPTHTGNSMATRAIGASNQRIGTKNWNAILRRAFWRSLELGGAVLLFAGTIFLAVALVTYHQTDPSVSTAAGGEVRNWMGGPGAWAAERALFLFGPIAVLFLPLLYVFARKLWRFAEEDDAGQPHANHAWWRPIGVLLFAMILLGTVLSLTFTGPGGSLPASMGGIAGLLGSKAIVGLAAFFPEGVRSWLIGPTALVCLFAGAFLAGRVFAIDWGQLMTLPGALRRMRPRQLDDNAPFIRTKAKAPREPRAVAVPVEAPRKPTEIADPVKTVRACPAYRPEPPGRPVRRLRLARTRSADRSPGQFAAEDRQAQPRTQRAPA